MGCLEGPRRSSKRFFGMVHIGKGFAETVEHAFDQARYITERLLEQKDKFKMVKENPESLNVCFW